MGVLELKGRQVTDRGVEPLAVVPLDPAGDLPFDGAAVGPGGCAVIDGFSLEQADGGLAQCVVQGLTG